MTRTAKRNRLTALALTTALATIALTGCTTNAAPPAGVSASKAQVALQSGETSQAVAHAEAAVLAQPRDARFRAVLGAAYMEAGRFQSAATSFNVVLPPPPPPLPELHTNFTLGGGVGYLGLAKDSGGGPVIIRRR